MEGVKLLSIHITPFNIFSFKIFSQYILQTKSQASSDLTECRQRLDSAIIYLDEAIFHMLFNSLGRDWSKIMTIIP